MEAKAKMYLLSTIDNIHILLVKDKSTAYDVYQTLCSRYEDKAVHGDPYYIQSHLMELKYEEDTDLTMFFLDLERSMKAVSEATSSILSDEQRSIYLFHSMPQSWKHGRAPESSFRTRN